jgi:hypothetical protein
VWLADNCGNCFRYRQFDQKSRTDRMIIFCMNRAAMFGNDASSDGQPQASAPIFRGKLRQE